MEGEEEEESDGERKDKYAMEKEKYAKWKEEREIRKKYRRQS